MPAHPLDPATFDILGRLSVATISMQLLKKGLRRTVMQGVRPLNQPVPSITGEAWTLRFIPAREDLSAPARLGEEGYTPRHAFEDVPSGAVLVIDGLGDGATAVLGDLLAERLKVRGVKGVVSDGGVRDCEEAVASGLPIFAAGPAAPPHIGGLAAGDVDVPIGCGGVAVIPGDIIRADSDGVVVIPRALAEAVAQDGPEQERYEQFAKEEIKAGRSIIGVYPPNEDTRRRYAAWCRDHPLD